MKSQIFKLLLVLVFSTLCFYTNAHSARYYYYLTVNVSNILIQKGKIYIGVCNNERDFDKQRYCAGRVVAVKGKAMKIVFKLPKGTYSVQMYQDTNNDNTMNNIFGVPLEPYGVSHNVSGFPSFKGTKFTLDRNKSINIKLKN